MRKTFLILALAFACIQTIGAQQFTVASYNIRNDNKGDSINGNAWLKRCPVIGQLIQFHDFDIVGTQEVLHNQLLDLAGALPEYSYISVGRDDGVNAGEASPIFFKTDRFTLLNSGHFWMSEQTDRPNKGWDAVLPRICTWIQLEDKESKLKLWYFNLHMDHRGVLARRESAKLVLAKMQEMCGTDPVILSGDFNVDQTHDSYQLLANSDILRDSYQEAKIRYAMNGTFNRFDPNVKTNSRIDHIFLSPVFAVERYGVLTDTYWSEEEVEEIAKSGDYPTEIKLQKYRARIPSDHYPIMVKIVYNKK